MEMQKKSKVVVAMSGGVDSSVAAAMLAEQGHEVIGIMLRLWSEPGLEAYNRCCTPESMGLARRVAAHLNIPFYVMDVRETFHERIVDYFLDGHAEGGTPNPCMMCNRHIRFGVLQQHAFSFGADYMATGHYARVRTGADGYRQLLKGLDPGKDQSYVLSVLNQEQLQHALFPIGELAKSKVRELAESYGLPVADRSDSQDLCFLAGGDYRDFLKRHESQGLEAGQIQNQAGDVIGEHSGMAAYTIGQRRGLGLSSPEPLFVIHKDVERNALVVGPRESLGRSSLIAESMNWLDGMPPADGLAVHVKIRYQARPAAGRCTNLGAVARIDFEQPQQGITPGQWAVVYDGDRVLGSGTIRAEIPQEQLQ